MSERAVLHSILVGVDGSTENHAAVHWAAAEASRAGCPLVLLAVSDDLDATSRHAGALLTQSRQALAEADADVRQSQPEVFVHAELLHGPPDQVIVDRGGDAALIVVGKRGHGAFSHFLVGSTSVMVVARTSARVAVVPEPWKQADHARDPIVLGIDPWRPEDGPALFALRRAALLDVPLVVAHGWEVPAISAWDAIDVGEMSARWADEAERELDRLLDSWHVQFPEVVLRKHHVCNHPATAVLDAAEDAQLVVLGRRPSVRNRLGFGSVIRGVLHYSHCPVLVIPETTDPMTEQLPDDPDLCVT